MVKPLSYPNAAFANPTPHLCEKGGRGEGWQHIILFTLLLGIALAAARPAHAQADEPRVEPIGIGMSVEDTITGDAPFDWWLIDAAAGDEVRIIIEAYEGLAPLIGILDTGRTLVARSDDGTPNGVQELRYVFPTAGEYTIVAARVGINDGTTTGRYTLTVERVGSPPVRDPNMQEVTFVCEGLEAVTLATIQFRADPGDMSAYRVTVIGESGVAPVIRFLSSEQATDVCVPPSAQDRVNATFTLPDGTTGASSAATSTQLVINPTTVALGDMTVIIGGIDGGAGRYIALIEGYAIHPASNADAISVRLGALPGESTDLLAYIIQMTDRLDPVVTVAGVPCDDAGRRGCEDVPAVTGVGVHFNELYAPVIGDRFDAGALIADTAAHMLTVGSFAGRTQGNYALMLIGEQPPRDFSD